MSDRRLPVIEVLVVAGCLAAVAAYDPHLAFLLGLAGVVVGLLRYLAGLEKRNPLHALLLLLAIYVGSFLGLYLMADSVEDRRAGVRVWTFTSDVGPFTYDSPENPAVEGLLYHLYYPLVQITGSMGEVHIFDMALPR